MNELIKQIKAGDREAFKALYDQYANYTIRVATGITRNKMVAADAVQETFIRVYNNINSFDEDKPFEPWLYRILINECNRILKNQSKTIPISNYLEEHAGIVEEDVYKFEEYEELYTAVNELDDMNRIPIILKYLEGFTELQIADTLNLNVNTVKSRLFKGREKLKKKMAALNERRHLYE
ncbi:RNA polymerase, sigma-24 subunit, ECF subfamily [Alkaliphilus metalliredigens QYMF]|uniref:RNA polymerase, sigma-24 subunit, ECF subfamily n=1 Tax=Alkaliphilus metalliredigens (strain QYMF) TaxID=293826 RepID=A6TNU0_ALKMQ|nr:RNA polymerase sigma factor [Alkaliphilus metalliredigens]ABR47858.1 RNA polymerase, sigma-24 subunit, ECF subfamily [Alkaliphilus metalliredigens QYMF]